MTRKNGSAAFPRRSTPPKRTAPGGQDGGREAPRAVRPLLALAAVLSAAAVFLPLWGMTLVSTQYPEGLRMVVYPTRIAGDIAEINVLNHYIGMQEISNDFFVELRLLPLLLAVIAAACLLAAVLRRTWATLVPLGLMAATAVYGFWSMRYRLHQFGHDLDPAAPIDIDPFTPPMFGEHTLAQFATWSYFSWGTFLAVAAGVLVAAALFLQLRRPRRNEPATVSPLVPATRMAALLAAVVVLAGCGGAEPSADARQASAAPRVTDPRELPPSPGEAEFARLTAGWSDAAREGCGPQLRDALGTRDLVNGALAGVSDPAGKAKAEVEDARQWIEKGDAKLAEVRAQLEAGACDGSLNVALDEAWQFYVKAGTSAVQAGQIAGS